MFRILQTKTQRLRRITNYGRVFKDIHACIYIKDVARTLFGLVTFECQKVKYRESKHFTHKTELEWDVIGNHRYRYK